MVRHFREDFDRDRSFVALKSFVFNARGYVPHQSIDKAQFTVRRLRQLFDRRDIGYPTVNGAGNAPDTRVQPVEEAQQAVWPVEAPAPTPASPERAQTPPEGEHKPVSRRRLRA